MANYVKTTVEKENRTELHEKLALTGAEISLNTLPAGAAVPFVHSHKENEEIYGVLSGKGKAVKKQIQEMTRMMLHLETIPKPDDTADALGMAIAHCHCSRSRLMGTPVR